MVIDINLDPTQGSETGKTRPVDHRFRLVKVRGKLDPQEMHEIDKALKIVFDLL